MCSRDTHIKKYKKNKELMESSLIKEQKYNDWRAVIIFYSALHMVDSVYANFYHPKNHVTRKDTMSKFDQCKRVLTYYKLLEGLSKKARYNYYNIENDEISEALICFSNIEKQLQIKC